MVRSHIKALPFQNGVFHTPRNMLGLHAERDVREMVSPEGRWHGVEV
jgi:hypothetical protein